MEVRLCGFRMERPTRRIFDFVSFRCADESEFLSGNKTKVTTTRSLFRKEVGNIGKWLTFAHIRIWSGGSFPFTSPRIFCRSLGTLVKAWSATFKSNTLDLDQLITYTWSKLFKPTYLNLRFLDWTTFQPKWTVIYSNVQGRRLSGADYIQTVSSRRADRHPFLNARRVVEHKSYVSYVTK